MDQISQALQILLVLSLLQLLMVMAIKWWDSWETPAVKGDHDYDWGIRMQMEAQKQQQLTVKIPVNRPFRLAPIPPRVPNRITPPLNRQQSMTPLTNGFTEFAEISVDPGMVAISPIKNLDCVRRKKVRIDFFNHLRKGKNFRYDGQWCVKSGATSYFDGYSNHLEMPQFTYIAAKPEDFF